VIASLIETCKLNAVDPQAWLADILARIANLPLSRLPELLPWEWARRREATAIAA
jgi:transposase